VTTESSSLHAEDSILATIDELKDYTPHAFGDITIHTKLVRDVDVRDPAEGGQISLNEHQPRHKDHWESPALRNQIEQAKGLFTPPFVMPTEQLNDAGEPVFEMVDGHRRITALRGLLNTLKLRLEGGTLSEEEFEQQTKLYSTVTVECTWRRLELAELIKVWLLIHRERREWSLQEREETAKQLVGLVGSSKAASFLGVTETVVQKLADTYELAQKIILPGEHKDSTGKDPRITWARELRNLREEVRSDTEMLEAVIARINNGSIKNSKDIRVLRKLGPEAREDVLDIRKDLVRDVAEPRGIQDPVHATRGGVYSDDLTNKLSAMATQIGAVRFEQLRSVMTDRSKRKQANASIAAMIEKLTELQEFVDPK
jgi:ParB family transcriptional regulator, chromosome partitioning protein